MRSRPVRDIFPEQMVWEGSLNGTLDITELIRGRPFCAGVLVIEDGSLLTTLSSVHGPAFEQDGREWWVGGVGGGQEPGEDPWTTAIREAAEELAVDTKLLTSSVTYVQDLDTSASWATTSANKIAPFAVQRISNADPARPFKPGVPAGPYTYFALFLAQISDSTSRLDSSDDTDIAALLWLPVDRLVELRTASITFATLEAAGATVATGDVTPSALIRLSPTESLAHLATLLAALPECGSPQ